MLFFTVPKYFHKDLVVISGYVLKDYCDLLQRSIFLYSSFSSSSKENETHGDKEFLFWNIDPNLGIKQNALAPTFTPDNRKCRTCTFFCFLTYSGFLPNLLTHAVWYCRLWFQSENVAVRELDGIYLTWYSQLNLYQPFSMYSM